MKNLQYQNEAVAQLVKMSLELLENDENEQNLVFKAPTGSGKTIMATRVLADLHEQLLAEGRQDVAFVWIAPQKLHLQSFEKLKAAFGKRYIDTYTYLIKNGYSSPDGLHYHAESYRKIYNYVMSI